MPIISSKPQRACQSDHATFLRELESLLNPKRWERLQVEINRRKTITSEIAIVAITEWLQNHEGMPLDAQGNE